MLFKPVSFLDKIIFTKNLSLMIKAGLPIWEGLTIIKEQSNNKSFKKILDKIAKDVNNGQPLAVSLSRHPGVFDDLYINMIKIGEESGTLEESLSRLSLQLEKSFQLKEKIKMAMIYPAIIMAAVVILGAALAFFILPKIIPVFKALDIQLPLATRILIGFTEVAQNYGLFIMFSLFFLAAAFAFLLRLRAVKFFFDKLVLILPIVGPISRNIILSNSSRTLGILLKSGIPVVSALKITQNSLTNLVFQKELKGAEDEVKKGKTISNYLKKKEKVFPLMVSRMVAVGEKTGNLEETLSYISDFYEAEVDKSAKNLSTVFEPILLLIVGLAVGLIAIAIISPIYEITRGLRI
ncbi:MAG: type II secretion system F family protein [bacterium]